jgi:hypothetical protein
MLRLPCIAGGARRTPGESHFIERALSPLGMTGRRIPRLIVFND